VETFTTARDDALKGGGTARWIPRREVSRVTRASVTCHDGAVGEPSGSWEIDGDRARIAVPVDDDRRPEATTTVAVALSRQSGLGIEFVGAVDDVHRPQREAELLARCDAAIAAGAPSVGWRAVDGGREDVASYFTWSGARLCCVGLAGHRHHQPVDHAIGAVPLLAVGAGWRPSTEPMRRVLVGLGGGWPRLEELAVAASSLAALLDVELAMIEVAEPDRPALDVPVSAHLRWVSDDLPRPVGWFDTVVARRTDVGLARYLDPWTVMVVGDASRQPGLAGRLLRKAPCPVVVVPPSG
jgi:hypothetical protein